MKKEFSTPLLRFTLALVPLGAAVLLTAFARPPTMLEQVLKSGELVVATRNSPTTYYLDANGPAGLEHDLTRLFANHLGVDLRIVEPEHFSDILPMVVRREVHLAAAGLSITRDRERNIRFGPPYQEVTQQLVYRNGAPVPRGPEELAGAAIEVVAGSSHAEQMRRLARDIPGIDWRENREAGIGDLLAQVWRREIPYTIADSNEFSLNQRYFPELRAAFDLNEPEQLAWAFAKGMDDSLLLAAREFFALIEADGRLEQVLERYYGHAREFDYVGVRRFLRHADQRLPAYLPTFQEAADRYGHDWRLLAAVGYQESHWDPRAISPTGVRGIMMLTRTTAADMGIQNRIDPVNSIRGGARYLHQIERHLPGEIRHPDRTWFALAAYNIGPGHLHDAREITLRRGGDPNRWIDVMDSLPLLMQSEWHQQTRFGYARGLEAVNYVQNIRGYYDILVWQTTPRAEAAAPEPEQLAAAPTPRALTARSYIPSPVL
jgi:membrane-bound lytic murein transglycosylase F